MEFVVSKTEKKKGINSPFHVHAVSGLHLDSDATLFHI